MIQEEKNELCFYYSDTNCVYKALNDSYKEKNVFKKYVMKTIITYYVHNDIQKTEILK